MTQLVEADPHAALLAQARDGDDGAFVALYEEIAPMAWGTALRLVRDANVADDIVQEAFYQILRAVRAGRGPTDSFSGYAAATVRRLAYRHLAAEQRTIVTDDQDVWERHLDTSDEVPPESDRFTAAWASLPARWRHVLWLIEVDRYSPAELAPGLAMTANAVSSLASRARRALRLAYAAHTGAV